jgi:hypothetical protein
MEMASSDLSMLPKGATVNGLLLMSTTMVLLQPIPAKKVTTAIKQNWIHSEKYILFNGD